MGCSLAPLPEALSTLFTFSNPLSVDVITAGARRSGLTARAETCPPYLTLDDTVYKGNTPERYLVAPPIRESALRDGMWDRLAKREVHTVGSTITRGYALCQRPRVGDFRKISVGDPGGRNDASSASESCNGER